MIDKNKIPTKLLWLDLEMTGLDPVNDLILEVAAEVTDFNLKTLETYESRLIQDRAAVAEKMAANNWWRDFPENRDDFINKISEGKHPAEVVTDLINLVERHFAKDELAILAGNSIHNDRAFIKAQWPSLELKLHYRMLDVSSFKILMQAKYGVIYEKQEPHRAFDDVQASIAELQHYLDFFHKQP